MLTVIAALFALAVLALFVVTVLPVTVHDTHWTAAPVTVPTHR